MKTLSDIPVLNGVKVLLRADFNVPIKNGKVADEFRLKSALPTIEFLKSKGAKVILISHLEVKDGEDATLEPVGAELNKLGLPVTFIKNMANAYSAAESMQNGSCILLENLRDNPGEKENDQKFAKELASLADIYVNDAFPVCHREHASIVSVPKYLPSYAGLQLEKEVQNLSKCFNPAHPFLFILCGAKFDTKLPLVKKFSGIADTVFIGGALANDLFKTKGYEVGTSLVSDELPKIDSPKLLLPADITNQNKELKSPDSLSKDDCIMDAGPKTVEELKEKIDSAEFILWNGTLGVYEKGYKEPTLAVARLIGQATRASNGKVISIVGGGDTVAAIAELDAFEQFTFVSTAGGAMLDFLANETLPGIEALENSTI